MLVNNSRQHHRNDNKRNREGNWKCEWVKSGATKAAQSVKE